MHLKHLSFLKLAFMMSEEYWNYKINYVNMLQIFKNSEF
jgi:hypothetical protein